MKAEEAEARAINAQPWEPPPGMVKRQCPECRYFFALLPVGNLKERKMSDGSNAREESFCWVVLGQNPPEIQDPGRSGG
jgi:hypothetical protein